MSNPTTTSDEHSAESKETIPQADGYPTDCVLCPKTAESHDDHQQHMEDAHNV